MRAKILTLILTLLFVAAFGIGQAYAGGYASYAIDSIYDDVNTSNYLDVTPTFGAGASYNVTIEGHGTDGRKHDAADKTTLGMFIDYDGDLWTDFGKTIGWALQPGTQVALGTSGDVGGPDDANYQIKGLFTIPQNVQTGTVDGLAFLSTDCLPGPFLPVGALIRSDDKEFFEANVVAPEPTTLALLSFGLLGGAGLRKRKRK